MSFERLHEKMKRVELFGLDKPLDVRLWWKKIIRDLIRDYEREEGFDEFVEECKRMEGSKPDVDSLVKLLKKYHWDRNAILYYLGKFMYKPSLRKRVVYADPKDIRADLIRYKLVKNPEVLKSWGV